MNGGLSKAKIICTIGPSTANLESIRTLVEEGMDAARLNFSHGSREDHMKYIRLVRRAAEEAGRQTAVIQDISGPKIRTGPLADAPVELETESRFTLTARKVDGNKNEVSVNYRELLRGLEPGDQILMADGLLELRVLQTNEEDALCEVVHGGELGEHKGINVPEKLLRLPSLTEKDRADLRFGIEQKADWIALSFVRTPDDILSARALLRKAGSDIPIIAKIEKRAALEHLPEILEFSDGVMVARGDLGVEIPMPEIPWVQKKIIQESNRRGLPVVTATQMLESMIENPRPTRAELTDVANALLDGADAVMLSGETAVGKYPFKALSMMKRIADTARDRFPYAALMAERHIARANVKNAVSQAACDLATVIGAKLIVCCTRSGQTARAVARFRPKMPIAAVSSDDATLRRLQISWGVQTLAIPLPKDTDDIIAKAKKAAIDSGMGKPGDSVVVVAGTPLDIHGTTNMLKADTL